MTDAEFKKLRERAEVTPSGPWDDDTVLMLLSEIERLRSRPWERLRDMGFEVDETGVRRQRVMEREIVTLRTALAEALALFDATWCTAHGRFTDTETIRSGDETEEAGQSCLFTRDLPLTTAETTKLRRACSNCPWRVDAPRGYWDPQHFIDIWRNCQDDGLNIMLCHKSGALPRSRRGNMPCQGWIRVMGFEAIGVRLLVMQGKATHEEVEDRDGPELFPSFAAMTKANKIRLPKRSQAVPMHRREAHR